MSAGHSHPSFPCFQDLATSSGHLWPFINYQTNTISHCPTANQLFVRAPEILEWICHNYWKVKKNADLMNRLLMWELWLRSSKFDSLNSLAQLFIPCRLLTASFSYSNICQTHSHQRTGGHWRSSSHKRSYTVDYIWNCHKEHPFKWRQTTW